MNKVFEEVAIEVAQYINEWCSDSEIKNIREGGFTKAGVKKQILDTIVDKIYDHVLEIIEEKE